MRPRGDRPPPGTAGLGLWVMLGSLSVFFGGAIVAYLVVRSQAQAWPPSGAPALPAGLWLGTALLLGSSATMHGGLAAIRGGDQRRLRRLVAATAALSLGFVAVQAANWLVFWRADTTFDRHLYGFTFYMLTGLHAAHVLGGLVVLAVVGLRAARGRYSWANHGGVRLAALYWHFLGAAWVALFAVLLVAG